MSYVNNQNCAIDKTAIYLMLISNNDICDDIGLSRFDSLHSTESLMNIETRSKILQTCNKRQSIFFTINITNVCYSNDWHLNVKILHTETVGCKT